MKRRDFLRNSAAISVPYFVSSHVLAKPGKVGANDRLRVGFIGCGGRSKQLMIGEKVAENADIVAICDCFLARADEALKLLPNADKINVYQDYRKMIEKEKLDAVFIPTTTHARALIAITAMQAGLDVYAEKPIALTVAEGRSIVKAVKHTGRVFQAGTQQRSMPINVWASKLVREGALGKVQAVMACNFIGPETWPPAPALMTKANPMPEGLDWEAWCNQTELRDYHQMLQFGWARWRSYDCGGISWGVSGWGTHALDQVQCALGTSHTGPVEIVPEGIGYMGCTEVTMRYANGVPLRLHGPKRDLSDLGAVFICEKGHIEIKRGSLVSYPAAFIKDAPPNVPNAPGETVDHIMNFFDCVRTRKTPNADVETAQRSTTLCLLVQMCRELGRKLQWNPETERFVNDDEANGLLSRERRKGYELPKEFA